MIRWGIVLGFCCALTLLAGPGEIDRRFKPKLPANARVTTVFEQSDGRLLVGGNVESVPESKVLPFAFFVRLRANGQLDHTFRTQREGLVVLGVNQIIEREDGIGVIGGFLLGTDTRSQNAVVFERNGKLTGYTPATNVVKGTWLPDGGIAFEGFQHGYNGRIGFLDANGAGPVYVSTPYLDSQFVWLKGMPDGDVIGYLFRPPGTGPGEPRRLMYSMLHGGIQWREDKTPVPALGPSNTLYLATDRLILWRGAGPFLYELPTAIEPRLPRAIPCLTVRMDGSVVYSMTSHGANFIFRCNQDGSDDQTFPTLLPNGPVNGLLALRNGQILAWGDFTEIDGAPAKNLVRLNSE
jgi:hypothetical protein